ncbi:MAG: ABC transporter ATP-binding protein [Telmatospirillum sp.]|nr:ABC transporter ATP-binding protein [Telmatospirillum sp.]
MASNRAEAAWSTLTMLLRGHRWLLGVAMLLTIIAAALELIPYALLCRSMTLLMERATGADFRRLLGWMALALLGKYVLYSLAYYFSHREAYHILMQVRQMLVRRLVWAPLPWLQRQGAGALKTLVMQDVERLEQFIAHHLVEMTAAVIAPVLVAIVLLWIDWRLAAAAMVTLPLAVLFQSIAMRGMDRRIAEHQQVVGQLNSATVEYLRNMPVMKVFRQDARSFQTMREGLELYHALILRVTRRTVPGWSVFMVLLNANIVFLLPVGLWLGQTGRVTFTQLLLALVLGNGMLRPLFKVMRFQVQIREILNGVRRLQPLLAMTEPGVRAIATVSGFDLMVDGVGFSHGEIQVLRAASFTIPAGRVTALVGPSGGGKTTVVNLLGGLIEPDQGIVRIGGVPLADMGEAQRSSLIAVAGQDTFLFRGSVLDNLRLARPEADETQIRRSLRIAGAEAFVDALPDGWLTQIGERGVTLSGGERQRLGVARAILADTPVLVLDESTAFADSRTERRFFKALRETCPDKTLLIVAHRLYSVKDADQIVVLQAGSPVDAGDHESLLHRCALYRRMWDVQSCQEIWNVAGGDAGSAIREVAHG